LKLVNVLCNFRNPGSLAILSGSVDTAASFGPARGIRKLDMPRDCGLTFCLYQTISWATSKEFAGLFGPKPKLAV